MPLLKAKNTSNYDCEDELSESTMDYFGKNNGLLIGHKLLMLNRIRLEEQAPQTLDTPPINAYLARYANSPRHQELLATPGGILFCLSTSICHVKTLTHDGITRSRRFDFIGMADNSPWLVLDES